MSTAITQYAEKIGALTVTDVREQVNLIQHVMREVMKKDEHYGVIPGTGTKPTLLKAGAEKLCLTFRLDPQYDITERHEGQHLTITSKCTLYHIPSSQRFGSGMGSCSTRESKYAYRQAGIKCPQCSKESVIKGKDEFGGGWVCFKKKGGCGAKFADGAEAIEKQPRGRIPNEDLADTYNTVLKMANKRSLVAAVLNTTAASDIFTQDIEDLDEVPARAGRGPSSPQRDPSAPAERDITDESEVLKVAPEQIEAINTALKESGLPIYEFLEKAGINELTELAAADAPKGIEWIRKQKKRAA